MVFPVVACCQPTYRIIQKLYKNFPISCQWFSSQSVQIHKMYDDIRQNSITVKIRTNILGERKMFKTKKKKFLLPFLMDLGWQMMVFQTLQEVLQGSLPAFQEWNSTANSPTRHPPRTNDHWRWCLELKRKIKSKGWLSLHSVHPGERSCHHISGRVVSLLDWRGVSRPADGEIKDYE